MAIDLYFAGSEAFINLVFDYPVNLLMSYFYGKDKFNKLDLDNDKFIRKIFVDSGAFTAWTKGKTINVDEYIDWINKNNKYINLYGQIDYIPGDIVNGATKEEVEEAAKKTWENYLYMRPKMKNPEGLLYTFHVGEPYQYLKQALEWTDENGNYIPYIALGGMVGKTREVKESFLEQCFTIIKQSSNPNVKVHAFGMTSFDLLEQYPITSADSTSWIMTGANGGIKTDIGIIQVSSNKKYLSNHYSHLDIKYQQKFNEQIHQYGFTLDELSDSYINRLIYHLNYMSDKANRLQYKPLLKNYKLF